MTDQFAELLHELGRHLHLPLHVDKHSACSIQTPENLTVQLELDISLENLFFFSKIIEIPPGKFRENVLRETLKANALPDPRAGIFGYLDRTNHLILFQRYPLPILNGERLAGLIGGFLELGNAWQKAIEAGRSAPPGLKS
ncbi:MAG TPA: CesT family type III secretion system chaperone [Chlamydiales bacterium]|nr:CesT family type III secretion system chaperone [Chlamydiales bacterium]